MKPLLRQIVSAAPWQSGEPLGAMAQRSRPLDDAGGRQLDERVGGVASGFDSVARGLGRALVEAVDLPLHLVEIGFEFGRRLVPPAPQRIEKPSRFGGGASPGDGGGAGATAAGRSAGIW
ncbi:MAG: hypothetical protein M5U33_12220 [Pseudorhodoplanes sp.]|nr:hypothetical protein [Pseudorhodoplanes sp.]